MFNFAREINVHWKDYIHKLRGISMQELLHVNSSRNDVKKDTAHVVKTARKVPYIPSKRFLSFLYT